MTKADLAILQNILEEDYQLLTELKEDLENASNEAFNAQEKEELLNSHNSRLKLLDKIGIKSFR